MAIVAAGSASGAVAEDVGRSDLRAASRGLDLTLNGHLPAECRVSGGGDVDFGRNLGGGLAATATFGFNCNIPFAIKVASVRGGLTHATQPRGEGPFAGTLGYTMDVRVPTRNASGPGSTVGGRFSSTVRSKTFHSGSDAIATGGGTISFLTDTPEGAGLLAGEYSDTVTVTVAAL